MKACRSECLSYKKDIKRLSKKKYPHAKQDIDNVLKTVLENPPGKKATALPKHKGKLWKRTVRSTDMQRGEQGGFRIIFGYDVSKPDTVYLLRAYAKPEREDLPHAELQRLYNRFVEHLESISKITKDTSPPSDG